jgi:Tol biopolymer transport system component
LTTNGKRKFIRLLPDDEISYSNYNVVWCDYSTNPRFEEESFNDIVIYNLISKKISKISNKKRYNSPAINNKANLVAAVTFNNKFEPIIDILDLNGNLVKSHTFENCNNIFDIAWSPDDSKIAISIASRNGLSLQIVDIENWKTTEIIAPQWIKFEKLIYTDKYIYFNYDYTGITNIFAYNI